MTTPPTRFVSVAFFALSYGVSRRTVRRWIHLGHVDAHRVGPLGHWRIRQRPNVVKRGQTR